MSLKAAFLVSLVFTITLLVAILVNRPSDGSVAESNTSAVNKAEPTPAPIQTETVEPPPKSELEQRKDALKAAQDALTKLSVEQPDAFRQIDELERQFADSKKKEMEGIHNKIAELNYILHSDLPTIAFADTAKLNTEYGNKVLQLVQEAASAHKGSAEDFVSTTKASDLLKYITKQDAASGKYDRQLRNAYTAHQLYFINLDPGWQRYNEVIRLDNLLEQYLAAVQAWDVRRRQDAQAAKPLLSQQINDLIQAKTELGMKTLTPPSNLADIALNYERLSGQVRDRQMQVDGLIAAQAAELQRQADAKLHAEEEQKQHRLDHPMEIWTKYSSGYTWKRATEEERRALCASLAALSTHGCSEQYFYDAFAGFYSGDSQSGEQLFKMAQLFESASRLVPRSERNY